MGWGRVAGLLLAASVACFARVERARAADVEHDRVYYQIFVRSFQDSDGDGIGDLRGITSRLDYLRDLGVGGIWLTPIFRSPSYHGYDTSDYRLIQPELGTIADLDELLSQAHARGIKVLLDFAVNHTSNLHPWFSIHRDWYVWREQDPGWAGESHWYRRFGSFYYALFGQRFPDLNLTNASLTSEIQDIARFWLARGVDGFRFDAIRYLIEGSQGEADTPETHLWIRELRKVLKFEYPRAFLLGEVWEWIDSIAPYVSGGDELDSAFHFPFSGAVLNSLADGNAFQFVDVLTKCLARLPDASVVAPFLTNHDMNRIATFVGGAPEVRDSRLKLAAAALLSQPGTPFIYYGEEIGMENSARGFTGMFADLEKRTLMQWTRAKNHGFTLDLVTPWNVFSSHDPAVTVEEQLAREGSLLRTYRELIALRQATPALRAASRMQVVATSSKDVAAYLRGDLAPPSATSQSSAPSTRAVLVVLNFGGVGGGGDLVEVRVELPSALAAGESRSKRAPRVIWGEGSVRVESGARAVVSGLAANLALWIEL